MPFQQLEELETILKDRNEVSYLFLLYLLGREMLVICNINTSTTLFELKSN